MTRFKLSKTTRKSLHFALGALLLAPASAFAQGDQMAPPPAPPQPAVAPPAPAAPAPGAVPVAPGAPGFDPRNFDFRNATPEQRRAFQEAMRAQAIEQMLDQSQVTDPAARETTRTFVKSEIAARQKLRTRANKLMQASRNNTPDAQIGALVADYQVAVQTDNARRKTDADAFAQAVNLDTQPRLKMAMLLAGLIDNAPAVFQIPGLDGGNGRGGQGGQGGRNGRRGGNRGGAQGQPAAPGDNAPQDNPPAQ